MLQNHNNMNRYPSEEKLRSSWGRAYIDVIRLCFAYLRRKQKLPLLTLNRYWCQILSLHSKLLWESSTALGDFNGVTEKHWRYIVSGLETDAAFGEQLEKSVMWRAVTRLSLLENSIMRDIATNSQWHALVESLAKQQQIKSLQLLMNKSEHATFVLNLFGGASSTLTHLRLHNAVVEDMLAVAQIKTLTSCNFTSYLAPVGDLILTLGKHLGASIRELILSNESRNQNSIPALAQVLVDYYPNLESLKLYLTNSDTQSMSSSSSNLNMLSKLRKLRSFSLSLMLSSAYALMPCQSWEICPMLIGFASDSSSLTKLSLRWVYPPFFNLLLSANRLSTLTAPALMFASVEELHIESRYVEEYTLIPQLFPNCRKLSVYFDRYDAWYSQHYDCLCGTQGVTTIANGKSLCQLLSSLSRLERAVFLMKRIAFDDTESCSSQFHKLCQTFAEFVRCDVGGCGNFQTGTCDHEFIRLSLPSVAAIDYARHHLSKMYCSL
jgi:hypothetical protein